MCMYVMMHTSDCQSFYRYGMKRDFGIVEVSMYLGGKHELLKFAKVLKVIFLKGGNEELCLFLGLIVLLKSEN